MRLPQPIISNARHMVREEEIEDRYNCLGIMDVDEYRKQVEFAAKVLATIEMLTWRIA